MAEWVEIVAKTVDEALTEALIRLETTSDKVEYEVLEKESSRLLGLISKPAKIRVRCKEQKETPVQAPVQTQIKSQSVSNGNLEEIANNFLVKLFKAMNLETTIDVKFDTEQQTMDININGEDMGVLIGKRGQTLDSLQYLTSLVVNKESTSYIKVKVDTENYRERRKETLENLAKNIAYKVKRTKHPVSLEPMNPYERRIIHSTLQYDKYVETHSEGDEPYRRVVVTLKKGFREYNNNRSNQGKPYNKNYNRNYKKETVTETNSSEQ